MEISSPLEEVAHLRKLAAQYFAKDEEAASRTPITDVVHAWLWQEEADALERGYLLGRAFAAFEVRVGLDRLFGNGSVHFDSDTEQPPEWLIRNAEDLARGKK